MNYVQNLLHFQFFKLFILVYFKISDIYINYRIIEVFIYDFNMC